MSIQSTRIFQRRKQMGLTQEELAVQIGTSQRQVSKYENGLNDPGADVVAALAKALNTTTDWLLGLTDIPERNLRGEGDLTEDERELIEIYRQKSPEQRHQFVEVARAL